MTEILKEKLSAADLVQYGYGQVEPNHLSAQRTAQIYAQLPMSMDKLEQGQFAKYDYAKNEINFTGAGEWMLVYSEVKTYGSRETNADFVNKKGTVYPRLFKTNVGDIFTTNTVKASLETLKGANVVLGVGEDGYLAVNPSGEWQVVKVYTLADGQPAVKVMKIK